MKPQNNVQSGFVKECAACGDHYVDTVSPLPLMHISEIPFHIRKTMERGGESFMEMVKRETRYGYCDNCGVYDGEEDDAGIAACVRRKLGLMAYAPVKALISVHKND